MEEIVKGIRSRNYKFKPKIVPILHSETAEIMLKKEGKYTLNLTLGRYSESQIESLDNTVRVEFNGRIYELEKKDLKRVVKKSTKLFTIAEEGLEALEIRNEHYYKLMLPPKTIYPTLEIDGIHMHRIKDTNPIKDTWAKIKTLGNLKGALSLDTCMGLGYTAILAREKGARVITVEKDLNVIKLAELNPWSHDLVNLTVYHNDVRDIISSIPDESLDVVVHDPPRFSLAGELYSLEFYREIHRVLKKRGKLFHYTGLPHSKFRGKSTVKGVGERLFRAGFRVKFDKNAQGYIAIKVF